MKVGDCVQAKSGGPCMTIEETPSAQQSKMYCIWFDGKKKLDGFFAKDSLKVMDCENDCGPQIG